MREVSLAIGCVLVTACASAQVRPTSDFYEDRRARTVQGADLFIAAVTARDDAAIAARFAPDVTFGGAWFTDASCRQQFSRVGAVPATGATAFAHCLATLALARSPYGVIHPEVIVFSQEPGLLLEARFDPDREGRLVYLGYAGRRTEQEALPVVSQDALLQQRTAATAFTVDDATRAEVARELVTFLGHEPAKPGVDPMSNVQVWIRVCIDAGGAVTSATMRDGNSIVGGEAIAAWIRTWTFAPFKLGDQPIPVCGVVAVESGAVAELKRLPMPVPASHADAVMLPPLSKLRRGPPKGVTPSPDDKAFLHQYAIHKLVGTVGYCIGVDGVVTATWTVLPTSLPNYDARLRAGAAKLAYDPYVVGGKARPVCASVTYIYSQR